MNLRNLSVTLKEEREKKKRKKKRHANHKSQQKNYPICLLYYLFLSFQSKEEKHRSRVQAQVQQK